jgi:hypothetical protein
METNDDPPEVQAHPAECPLAAEDPDATRATADPRALPPADSVPGIDLSELVPDASALELANLRYLLSIC